MLMMWTVFVVVSVHVWWLKPRQDENVRVSWNTSVYKALANAPAAFHGVIIALLAWPIRSTAGTVAYALLAGAYWASYVDARERRAAANAEANQARDFCDARVCPAGAGEEGTWLNAFLQSAWADTIEPTLCLRLATQLSNRMQKITLPAAIESVSVIDTSFGTECPRVSRVVHRGCGASRTSVELEALADYKTNANNSGMMFVLSVRFKHKMLRDIPLRLRVCIVSFKATMRIRVLGLNAKAPFYEHIRVSLAHVPKVDIAINPYSSETFDFAELPGLDRWIHAQITRSLENHLVEPHAIFVAAPGQPPHPAQKADGNANDDVDTAGAVEDAAVDPAGSPERGASEDIGEGAPTMVAQIRIKCVSGLFDDDGDAGDGNRDAAEDASLSCATNTPESSENAPLQPLQPRGVPLRATRNAFVSLRLHGEKRRTKVCAKRATGKDIVWDDELIEVHLSDTQFDENDSLAPGSVGSPQLVLKVKGWDHLHMPRHIGRCEVDVRHFVAESQSAFKTGVDPPWHALDVELMDGTTARGSLRLAMKMFIRPANGANGSARIARTKMAAGGVASVDADQLESLFGGWDGGGPDASSNHLPPVDVTPRGSDGVPPRLTVKERSRIAANLLAQSLSARASKLTQRLTRKGRKEAENQSASAAEHELDVLGPTPSKDSS